MDIHLKKYIPEEELKLGFLFSRRDNKHLIELLDLCESKSLSDISREMISQIYVNHTEDTEVKSKNMKSVYNAIKLYLLGKEAINNDDISSLKNIKAAFDIDGQFEVLSKELNLKIAQRHTRFIFEDNELQDTDFQGVIAMIPTLVLTPEMLAPLWEAEISQTFYTLQQQVSNGDFDTNLSMLVARFSLMLSLCEMTSTKFDIPELFSKINLIQITKKEPLIPFYHWLGYKSFNGAELFFHTRAQYGKMKSSGFEDIASNIYLFQNMIIIHNYEENQLFQFTGIKKVSQILDAINDVKYLQFQPEGQRLFNGIKEIENAETYNLLFAALSGQSFVGGTVENLSSMVKDDPFNALDDKKAFSAPTTPTPAKKTEKPKNANQVDVYSELNNLVGITEVKEQIRSLSNLIKVQQMRSQKGLQPVRISLHSVFTGAPGTGKTTVARLYAGILKDLGILKKGHLIEVDRAELVAGYSGQTAIKTDAVINSALDGVLFIDEAYSLVSKDSQDGFGEEAINVLLKRMEDDRDRLVVIVAGYSKEMHTFIESNPGFQSRFSRYIEFPNYSADELLEIFIKICKSNDYTLSEDLSISLKDHFNNQLVTAGTTFGNARYARNLFEKMLETQGNRVAAMGSPSDTEISQLVVSDLDKIVI
jgi:SpoVK/Ycf46/Vps4 family AAA+-type ATPase